MAKKDNIKITLDINVIKKCVNSKTMLDYIDKHLDSTYVLIYKYLTHSDLISSWKRSEKQWLDHNLLNYLSIKTMEEMAMQGNVFETAHQSCITLPKFFSNTLWFETDRKKNWWTIQYHIEDYANIYLVNDTLDFFSPEYTTKILNILGKDLWKWKFNEYVNLQSWDFTQINLTWAAHGIWTEQDTEFHKLRKHLFRWDTLLTLIENRWWIKNIFMMFDKNPRFFTILWIKNETWLKLTELKISKIKHEFSKVTNLGISENIDGENNIISEVTRAKQSSWRKQLAEEMMNYSVHDNEIFCPLTWIRVDFDKVWTLFRASHIKAYKDSNEYEKYDINNWILMCANADALFDKHLFTIWPNGELIFSELIKQDRSLLNNLLLSQPIFKEILNPQRMHYLENHRKVFEEKEKKRLSWNENLWDSEEWE